MMQSEESYRQEWASLTRRPAHEVYIPRALRSKPCRLGPFTPSPCGLDAVYLVTIFHRGRSLISVPKCSRCAGWLEGRFSTDWELSFHLDPL